MFAHARTHLHDAQMCFSLFLSLSLSLSPSIYVYVSLTHSLSLSLALALALSPFLFVFAQFYMLNEHVILWSLCMYTYASTDTHT